MLLKVIELKMLEKFVHHYHSGFIIKNFTCIYIYTYRYTNTNAQNQNKINRGVYLDAKC